VGLAYHAGVLRALSQHAGFDADSADLVIGTSAGSVIAAYVRAGWSAEDLWDVVLSGPSLPPSPEADGTADIPENGGVLPRLFVARFHTPVDLARHVLGSSYVLARSVLRAPLPSLPDFIQRAFPAGLFDMAEGKRRFREELPEGWPSRATWLVAMDIVSGRRMVLGRRRPPRLSLPQAVMASCAIPGAYPPVRYGRRLLIDGGAHSTTNLDLAVAYGAELIIAVAPMSYDPGDPPPWPGRLARRIPSRSLDAELARADREGIPVFLVRPSAREIALHGVDLMRSGQLREVAEGAYQSTTEQLKRGELDRMVHSVSTRRAG
jgi:NTE family protein